MTHTVPVAVVGLGAFTPGASDVAGFWRTVLSGRDMITDVPSSHWLVSDYYDPDPHAADKTYGRRGAFLSPVSFDPLSYGVPPKSVQATDTTQLLSLMVADAVLRDMGGQSSVDRDRMSVILGSAPLELLYNMASRLQRPVWLKSLREAGVPESEAVAICDRIASHYVPWQEASFPGMLSNVVAGRIANRFDLHGTNCTTDAACASSLAAVSSAVNELSLGISDVVLTGGVDTLNDILMYMCFSKTPALSSTGDCRPFSSSADGTMLGEALVMFALKRLTDAEAAGDRIYAVIRGIGTASDGKSTAIYAPLPAGQSRSLSRAYTAAGYGPDTVELVEAHGTGTVAGDAAEFAALRSVFASSGRADTQWCALGSVKSQIGHTKAAAGAAGMLKAVLSLQHNVLPPTIKVSEPNPALDLASSPLYLNTSARPWVRSSSHPRRASVSSFGFGGSNFHLALEEYTGPSRAWRSRAMPCELVLLSASSVDDLISSAHALSGTLPGIARQSQTSFDCAMPFRLAIIASSFSDLQSKVEQFASRRMSLPGIWYASGDASPGSVAFLFPGQGSQYVGMGADVAMHFPSACAVWDRHASLGVHQTVFPIPAFSDAERSAQQEALTATECAQPALALTSLSLLSILDTVGLRASCVAGHSFGELVALHYAGALSESALLSLSRRRGELMREAASTPGAMLAVTATRAEVETALASCTDWWIANHNSPTQVIISGTLPGIAAAEEALPFPTQRLQTATAFHSPVVSSASSPLLSFLSSVDVSSLDIPVYGNADGLPYPTSPSTIRSRIASHLATPVDFVAQITSMHEAGVRTFIEVGAGAAVSRLVSQTLSAHPHVSVSLDRRGRDGITSLFDAFGQLAVAGVAMDLSALWADYAPEPEPQHTKPRMTMPISGANYDRPYPPAAGESALPAPNPDPAATLTPAGSAPGIPQAGNQLAGAPLANIPAAGVPAAGIPAAGVPVANGRAAVAPGATVPPTRLGSGAPVTVPTARPATPTSGTPAGSGAAATWASPTGPGAGAPATSAARTAAAPAPTQGAPAASPAHVTPHAVAPVPADTGWLAVYQELQRQTAEVHTAYQQAMTETHLSYLRATEASMHSLASALGGADLSSFVPTAPPALPSSRNAPAEPIVPTFLDQRPVHAPGFEPAPQPVAPDIEPAPQPTTLTTPPATPPALPLPTAPGAPSGDLQTTLLAVVADKTGYPADMLQPDMELEGDLGIDSIKRVEILSALREHAPHLPELDTAALGKLRTLGEIADTLQATQVTESPATAVSAFTPPHAAAPYPAPSTNGTSANGAIANGTPVTEVLAALPSAPIASATAPANARAVDLEATLLAVVSDKTGYPADMLQPDMELEGDLGIDSIKRVEILSALREQAPHLPELDTAALGKLRTLGEIADTLQATETPHTQATEDAATAKPITNGLATTATPTTSAAQATTPADLQATLLQVVADKTGYPADVLQPDMELETDLGIDSIKRVEILSALRERVPNLPEVNVSDLGKLRTLGEIAATLQPPAHSLSRQVVRMAPAKPSGLQVTGLTDGRLVVTDDGDGVAHEVVTRLAEHHVKAEVVTEVPDDATGVIFLGGLREHVDELINHEAFKVAQQVADRARLFVTVQDTGGDFGLSGSAPDRVWLGGIAGLARCAAREWPDAQVKIIDVQRDSDTAKHIVDELTNGGSTLDVGIRNGVRHTVVTAEEPVHSGGKISGVVVATGGARGVTAEALIELAKQHQPKIVLIGRTPLDEDKYAGITDETELKRAVLKNGDKVNRVLAAREVRDTIGRIEETGAQVRYEAVDVTDHEQLQETLDKIRAEWGPITGIVHGAGVLKDKRIEDLTDEQYHYVVDTKVKGLKALLDATANDPVTHLCLFSSMAARVGNGGQSAYAIANEVLNQVAGAEQAKNPDRKVVSIAWGAWEGGMVTPTLAQHFRSIGVPLIPVEQGAKQFVEELAGQGKAAQVVIAPSGANSLDGQLRSFRAEIRLSDFPVLDDHVIDGTPVLPIALAVEWFAAATEHHTLLDVSVLRKITGADEMITLRGRANTIELTTDVPHYRAVLGDPTDNTHDWTVSSNQHAQEDLYDGFPLFHGPRFQAITDVRSVTGDEAEATVIGAAALGWEGDHWRTDPAAVDACLQLALLWGKQVFGGSSVPMSVREFRLHRPGLVDGPVRCVLKAGKVHDGRAECDVALLDADGEARAELFGVSIVRRPQ